MAVQHNNPAGVSKPVGYTHVVTAETTRTVYVAGQVATNAQGELVGPGDLSKQAEQVFENLKACLTSAGATFDNVVKMNTYIVNYKPEDRAVIVEMRERYLSGDKPPAATLVGVQALARADFMIEIEVIATL